MSLSKLRKLLLRPFEIILVIGYIVFEEFIWNTISKPIIEYLKSLSILENVKQTFLEMNRYLLVTVFIVILMIAEYLGIFSLIMIAQNQVTIGMLIYALKIPIATFVFWLFDLTKPQLMTFGWLKFSYETLINLIDFVVSSTIYQAIKAKTLIVKQSAKALSKLLKNTLLFKAMLHIYKRIKAIFI